MKDADLNKALINIGNTDRGEVDREEFQALMDICDNICRGGVDESNNDEFNNDGNNDDSKNDHGRNAGPSNDESIANKTDSAGSRQRQRIFVHKNRNNVIETLEPTMAEDSDDGELERQTFISANSDNQNDGELGGGGMLGVGGMLAGVGGGGSDLFDLEPLINTNNESPGQNRTWSSAGMLGVLGDNSDNQNDGELGGGGMLGVGGMLAGVGGGESDLFDLDPLINTNNESQGQNRTWSSTGMHPLKQRRRMNATVDLESLIDNNNNNGFPNLLLINNNNESQEGSLESSTGWPVWAEAAGMLGQEQSDCQRSAQDFEGSSRNSASACLPPLKQIFGETLEYVSSSSSSSSACASSDPSFSSFLRSVRLQVFRSVGFRVLKPKVARSRLEGITANSNFLKVATKEIVQLSTARARRHSIKHEFRDVA